MDLPVCRKQALSHKADEKKSSATPFRIALFCVYFPQLEKKRKKGKRQDICSLRYTEHCSACDFSSFT